MGWLKEGRSFVSSSSCIGCLIFLSLLGQFWCTEPAELISPAEKHVLFARLMNSASMESSLLCAGAGVR